MSDKEKDKDKENEKDKEKLSDQNGEQADEKKKYRTIINTKPVPSICMLLAGIVRCIFGIIYRDELKSFLWTLVLVMICFYIIGFLVKGILDRNFKEMIEDAPVETPEEERELENIEETDGVVAEEAGFIQEKLVNPVNDEEDMDSF